MDEKRTCVDCGVLHQARAYYKKLTEDQISSK